MTQPGEEQQRSDLEKSGHDQGQYPAEAHADERRRHGAGQTEDEPGAERTARLLESQPGAARNSLEIAPHSADHQEIQARAEERRVACQSRLFCATAGRRNWAAGRDLRESTTSR